MTEERWLHFLCSFCDGSGEGLYDGLRCAKCKGEGVILDEGAEHDDTEL